MGVEKDEEGKEPCVLVLGPQPTSGISFLPGSINCGARPGDGKFSLLQSSVPSALECVLGTAGLSWLPLLCPPSPSPGANALLSESLTS